MAKLRHIAVHTPDPEKTAEFYKRVFDMVEKPEELLLARQRGCRAPAQKRQSFSV